MSSKIPPPQESLQSRLLQLVNEVLPGLRSGHAGWPSVTASTPLFENGRIDSLAILHLIGAIEEFTGRPVPDHLVSMKYFYSIDAITATFESTQS